MEKERFVYSRIYKDYGKIVLTVDEVLKKRKINAYRLSVLTGIHWSIIKRYVKGTLYRVDLDLLSRMCYALNCPLEELIHYEQDSKRVTQICKEDVITKR